MRAKIAAAIVHAFERSYQEHGANFDPDTCYEAADEVIAVLLSELSGRQFLAKRDPRLIAPAVFVGTEGERQ